MNCNLRRGHCTPFEPKARFSDGSHFILMADVPQGGMFLPFFRGDRRPEQQAFNVVAGAEKLNDTKPLSLDKMKSSAWTRDY
jgi:hypothetical protein